MQYICMFLVINARDGSAANEAIYQFLWYIDMISPQVYSECFGERAIEVVAVEYHIHQFWEHWSQWHVVQFEKFGVIEVQASELLRRRQQIDVKGLQVIATDAEMFQNCQSGEGVRMDEFNPIVIKINEKQFDVLREQVLLHLFQTIVGEKYESHITQFEEGERIYFGYWIVFEWQSLKIPVVSEEVGWYFG